MANIIENVKKVKRVLHRFDTAENWKKSSIKLLPGELAFDDNGNFKVGLNERPQGTLWNDLPYAGKSKFVSGTTTERPTISKNDSYTQGDMFKDITTNKWYFLTGFDAYGEYIWEELTFGSHDIESSIDALNTALENKVDASVFEEELLKKADVSSIDALNTALKDKVDASVFEEELFKNADKIESLDESVRGILEQLKEMPTGEVLANTSNSLMAYTDEKFNEVNNNLAKKATKDELQRALAALEEKHNLELSTLDISVDKKLSLKADKEELESLIAQKVDISTLFDESGIIRSSLLPGSVDDIVEGILVDDTTFMTFEGEQVGVGGKLYLDVKTKILYRWSGSQYVSISSGNSGLVLGTTAGTAYEGSSGKALEDRVTTLENRTLEQANWISSAEVNLENLTTNVGGILSTVEEHTKSISFINAKIEDIDELKYDIKEHDSAIKEHDTALTNVNNKLSLIEAKNEKQDELIEILTTNVTKVNDFDDRLKNCEKSISTLEITTETITTSLNNFSNLDKTVENLNSSVSGLTTSLSEQDDRIDSLENKVYSQKTDIDALKERVDAQKTLLETAQGFSDRIITLETSNSTQNDRLSGIESTVATQLQDISYLQSSVDGHTGWISSLEEKVDNLLKLDTPDGTLTLGKLAFQDKVQNKDIEGVSITKLMQEEDEELELWCGDSNF